MASTPGFEPRPHWWEASTLTTAQSLKQPGNRVQFQAFTLSLNTFPQKVDSSNLQVAGFLAGYQHLMRTLDLEIRLITYLEALRFGNPLDSSRGSLVLDPLKSQRNDLANGKIPAEGSALGR